MNAHVTIATVIASNTALDAACDQIFAKGKARAKQEAGLHSIVRDGLAGIAKGGDAFKSATRELRVAYELGNLVGAGYAKDKASAIEVRAKNAKVETRDKASYQCQRSAASNFSHAMRIVGYVSDDARANNARKTGGTQSQTAPSGKVDGAPAKVADKAAPAPVLPAVKFNKSYDARGRMAAIAADLAKAMNAAPNAFNGGLQAIAFDFVTRMNEWQKAQDDAAQN